MAGSGVARFRHPTMATSNGCTIDILLATYNGVAYLPALLRSIGEQTHDDWRLVVRDDGSNDGTLDVLDDWSKRYPGRVRLVTHDGTGRGARANFSALLDLSDAPYFMFCDQDDVWLPEKMTLFCRCMHEAEAQRGPDVPVLVHSDLVVVDRELRQVAPSFWAYQRLIPKNALPKPATLMIANYVTGCASMGNAALRRMSRPIPDEAAMHDWWLALVAANLGELRQIRSPTVLYRQHGGNQIGARSWSFFGQLVRFAGAPGDSIRRTRAVLERTQRQAAAFADRFDGAAERGVVERFRYYSQLRSRSALERKMFMWRNRLWPHYWIRAAAMWWFM